MDVFIVANIIQATSDLAIVRQDNSIVQHKSVEGFPLNHVSECLRLTPVNLLKRTITISNDRNIQQLRIAGKQGVGAHAAQHPPKLSLEMMFARGG